MRAIEFRAWDKKEKEMLYEDEDHYEHYKGFEARTVRKFIQIATNEVFVLNVDLSEIEVGWAEQHYENMVLMQFTGRRDKNKRKVFEGDVLLFDGIRYEVKWLEQEMKFAGIDHGGELNDFSEATVIGNIYENSEYRRFEANTRQSVCTTA